MIARCDLCQRNPERMNSEHAECSHCDCPHRRHAWSERPTRDTLYRGPWGRYTEADPRPLDPDKELPTPSADKKQGNTDAA